MSMPSFYNDDKLFYYRVATRFMLTRGSEVIRRLAEGAPCHCEVITQHLNMWSCRIDKYVEV